MQYWKSVEAGDHKTYASKILELYHTENKSYFQRINYFWNQIRADKKDELIRRIPEMSRIEELYGPIKQLSLLILCDDTSTLHTDHTIGLNSGVEARLNIPVLNCEGSITAFFKFDDLIRSLFTIGKDGTKCWPYIDRYYEKPITQVELVQPTILRTSEPHTVLCKNCTFPRISLTMSFETDIVSQLE
jgi:hypothetical protein